MTWAAVLLAAAVLVGGSRRRRPRAPSVGAVRRAAGDGRHDSLATAASLDVLAACLTAGMAVSQAAAATAPSAPAPLARLLSRAAELLALGADPQIAWSSIGPHGDPSSVALMRLARRSAASGTALAEGVAELATQLRHDAADAAVARAERASVLIAGPLGLCYLPAFLCLGIVPVVAGLADQVLGSGVI